MGLRKLVVIPVVALGFFIMAPAASAWMADLCISIGGHEIYQTGTASCETDPGWNFAWAEGELASAEAGDGNHNVAVAKGGYQSLAIAGDGDHNTAVAKWGELPFACAGGTCQPPCPKSDDATVECVSTADNGDADNNTAYAFHGGEAYAGGIGDFDWNKAVAIGNCIAAAVWDTGDTDFCKAPTAPAPNP